MKSPPEKLPAEVIGRERRGRAGELAAKFDLVLGVTPEA
jgi:hypothetical protein